MITFPANTRIWIAAGVTDMRRGFTGLSAMVQTALEQDPLSGHVFVFRGRRGDLIKAVVVRRRWTLPVCQTLGAWTLRVAEGRQRHGVADACAVVDVVRRDRLAPTGAHG